MNWTRILILIAFFAVVEIAWQILKGLWRKRRERGIPSSALREIGPARVLQKKYGLYAENAPEVEIVEEEVPEDLRDLIPLAKKYGVGDDIIRGDIEAKAGTEAKEELKRALSGRMDRINRWLDSFPDGESMSDSEAAFLYLREAHEEWAIWED